MDKKITLVIFMIAIITLAVFSSIHLAISTQTKPPGKDWKYVECKNGVGHWEYTGEHGHGEREPKEKSGSSPAGPASGGKPSLAANPNWVSIVGYSDSFNQCNSLCSAYQQHSCDSQFALQYCNAVVPVDLNKDGTISSSEIGNTPAGTRNCETNARCYDVIPSCACGNQPLSIGSCIYMLYQSYTKTGLSVQQALQNVQQETTSGCRPPQT